MGTKRLLLCIFSVLLLGPSLFAGPPSVAYGVDVDGKSVVIDRDPEDFLVLVFVASDCPISERYLPEIERLAKEFAGKPVRFWVVYPNPHETVTLVREQMDAFGLHLTVLLDPEQSLTAAAGPRVTPEAAVFSPVRQGSRHELYLGRIDNRYINFGEEKPDATQHDLEAAIKAVLAGGSAHPATGASIGCTILPAGIHLPPKSKPY